ncbi:metallophosphoesterase family protein [Tardiphaga sp.]|uniref:metallophosphoesterase family protein n=1 Tax=Tardiphaga sp. TaxID=1926292 RepID=UPI00262A5B05|nr:metallophosphoesterase family protein [Tardiphaga sp.]MDB5616819.1 metallophosphoesterase [Tardiphaga sp.]
MQRLPTLPQPRLASLPPQTRVYAIGDIHGRADLLADLIARIDDDVQRRPITDVVEVYLGDYIDRGADSRGVIDLLAMRMVQNKAICLRGNHEVMWEAFLRDPSTLRDWAPLGALPTLDSYDVSLTPKKTPAELHRLFCDQMPRAHELFLQCLRDSFVCGDFFFVHAGIRPGVPIAQQEPNDMHWIRHDFLDSTAGHGCFVVHGHTPVPHPDIRSNRINIDTGAWRTGVLTCIAIEGADIMIL